MKSATARATRDSRKLIGKREIGSRRPRGSACDKRGMLLNDAPLAVIQNSLNISPSSRFCPVLASQGKALSAPNFSRVKSGPPAGAVERVGMLGLGKVALRTILLRSA